MKYEIESGFVKPEKKPSTAVAPASKKTKRIITLLSSGLEYCC
jgi:hypothetical protein